MYVIQLQGKRTTVWNASLVWGATVVSYKSENTLTLTLFHAFYTSQTPWKNLLLLLYTLASVTQQNLQENMLHG